MSEIKRYRLRSHGMVQTEGGYWIKAANYDRLAAQLEIAKAGLEATCEHLHEAHEAKSQLLRNAFVAKAGIIATEALAKLVTPEVANERRKG